ncbi:copia protein, partial [Tanacetum coccineum]
MVMTGSDGEQMVDEVGGGCDNRGMATACDDGYGGSAMMAEVVRLMWGRRQVAGKMAGGGRKIEGGAGFIERRGRDITKWVFRNKLDENGVVSRNKARLVAQGYDQEESIDYDETYAPVARLESIRILLAYAFALNFKLFQMDVKSAFLNGFINEE